MEPSPSTSPSASTRHLLHCSHSFDVKEGQIPTYSETFLYWREGDEVYRLQSVLENWRALELGLEQLPPGERIPSSSIYPPLHEHLLRFDNPPGNRNDIFVKEPSWGKLHSLSKEAFLSLRLTEAQFYEDVLLKAPHANICHYLGALSADGTHLTGLVFPRYALTLHQAIGEKLPLNVGKIMERLRDAVAHLHTLGWIHNDLAPQNVMFRSRSPPDLEAPILIDFDSCRPVGYVLGVGDITGSPYYSSPSKSSTESRDTYSLHCVEKFLTDYEAVFRVLQN